MEELIADGVTSSLRAPTWPDVWLPRLETYIRTGDVGATLRLLRVLVPAYRPSAGLRI